MPDFFNLLEGFKEFESERLAGYVESYPEPLENSGQEYLPVEESYDINYTVTQVEAYRTMGYIVNYDTEAPVKSPGKVAEITGAIPLIKHKTLVTEKEMYELFNPRKNDTKHVERAKRLLYNRVDGLLVGIYDVFAWLRYQVLGHDELKYNKFGVKLDVNFNIPQKLTLGVNDIFSNANSTPWDFLREQLLIYKRNNKGQAPDVMEGSSTILWALQRHPQTRNMISDKGDRPATMQELNSIIQNFGLPPFKVNDGQVYHEDPDHQNDPAYIIDERLIPEKRLLFLAKHQDVAGREVGKLILGPIRESDWQPRPSVKPFDNLENDSNPSAGFKGVGSAMPALMVPSKIAQFDVL